MDIQKFLLLLVFCFSGYLLVDAWQKEHQPLNQSGPTPAQQKDADLPILAHEGVTGAKDNRIPATTVKQPATENITVRTDYLVARIGTQGGDINYLEFTKHRAAEDKTKSFVLLQEAQSHTYIVQSGLVGNELPNHKTMYSTDGVDFRLGEGENELTLRLHAETVGPNKVTKIYTFYRSSYQVNVAYEITNNGKQEIKADPYYQIVRDSSAPLGDSKLMPTYTGMAYYSDTMKYNKVKFSDVDKNKAPSRSSANGWVAMVQHYFVAAWVLPDKTQREFYFKAQPEGLYATGVITTVGPIKAGETLTTQATLYAGPEEQDKLIEAAPGLELTTDYGWLTIIAKPLFWVLKKIHSVVGNWGVAIILLTVLVKLIFYPLSAASYKSMARMRVLTPKLQKLREQYGSDRQKQHQAMVELYRTEKVNPLGGCLPIVVQIPVFIALYWVLLAAIELRHAPFFLWIQDLAAQDPYYILPILMGASMFFQTRLNPVPPDPIQAKIMKIMPIAFSIFFFFFPAGLVLYWLVNNILSIAQQWQITRVIERAGIARGKR